MPPLELPGLPRNTRPRRRRGPRLESLTLALETITPILGGGPAARQLDELEFIRAPTLRGHLRFWWRALYGHRYVDQGKEAGKELAKAEKELWGGMGGKGAEARRSQVEMRVTQVQCDPNKLKDAHPISLGAHDAYALWPARGTQNEPTAPRWKPGLRFTLELLVPEGEPLTQVRNALRAWLLFGGYGSRTRRGCGSVALQGGQQRDEWLPRSATRSELRRLFGGLPLFEPGSAGPLYDVPLLRGATLYRGGTPRAAMEAWLEALAWVREFRQGPQHPPTSVAPGQLARNPGEPPRAGRSNWPEADKLRHHAGRDNYPREHAPRPEYTERPAWPRAGFGLPIVIHFQQKSRHTNTPYQPQEPKGYELRWTQAGELRDRLASPLIVKALPLADGRFEPVALWMERGNPKGQVVLVKNGREQRGTGAPFDQLRAEGDRPLFTPLREARTLREAFLGWLETQGKAREA